MSNWPKGHLPKRPIVVDTREQAPYRFPGAISRALKQGDYSVDSLESIVVVERKSPQDLVGSLTSGRSRFEREMKRLRDKVRFPWVVVEASVQQIAAGDFGRSEVSPRSILGSAFAWSMRYGVFFLFAGDRAHAEAATAMILRLGEQEHEREARQAV